MHKTFIVAQTEFATLVRTKAFILSMILMPVLMTVSFLVVDRLKDAKDVSDRRFAFVDESGVSSPRRPSTRGNGSGAGGPNAAGATSAVKVDGSEA
jgi:ABC-type Na+ efflux pump permease subunit